MKKYNFSIITILLIKKNMNKNKTIKIITFLFLVSPLQFTYWYNNHNIEKWLERVTQESQNIIKEIKKERNKKTKSKREIKKEIKNKKKYHKRLVQHYNEYFNENILKLMEQNSLELSNLNSKLEDIKNSNKKKKY